MRQGCAHFASTRHAAGTLVAREAGAHFVQAFLGHSRMSTTERYLHAKSRPQDVDTLKRAFAGSIAPVGDDPQRRCGAAGAGLLVACLPPGARVGLPGR